MQCISPRLIKNPGWALSDPNSIQAFTVPCGYCVGCRIAKTREWSIRLLHELSDWDDAVFLTLTYDDDHLPSDGSLVPRDLQLFFKRLRKKIGKKKIKMFSCGEYGERTGRCHFHSIVYGLSVLDHEVFKECWPYGFTYVGSVTYDSCKYVAGYIQKKLYGKRQSEYEGKVPPFMHCSKHLGFNYVMRNKDRLLADRFITVNGVRLGLPRYYRQLLGVDTEEFFSWSEDRRNEVDQIFTDRVGKFLDLERTPNYIIEHEKGRLMYESRLQYGKNMAANLALKDRKKC